RRFRSLLAALAAERDPDSDRDELGGAAALLNAHVADLGEEARRPSTKRGTAPEIPRELGLGRVDGRRGRGGLDLEVVDAAPREQVRLHDRRGQGNLVHEISDPADELRVPSDRGSTDILVAGLS